MARDQAATIGAGSPGGPSSISQVVMSVPGKPASAMVGTSGKPGWRALPVTASGRTSPPRICPAAVLSTEKPKPTSFFITASRISPPPR